MSGVRQVITSQTFSLDPQVGIRFAFPREFVANEPDPERVSAMWAEFVRVSNSLCRRRCSGLINKYLRRATFHMGMEKICLDFSRRTENIKIAFHHRKVPTRQDPKPKTTYSIRIVKLSDVTEEARNARMFQLAVVPYIEPEQLEAQAQLIGDVDAEAQNTQEQSTLPSVVVPVEIIGEECHYPERSQDTIHSIEPANYESAPLASEVVVITDGESEDRSRSSSERRPARTPLERMQELDSICRYLTDEEYANKRQEILDGI